MKNIVDIFQFTHFRKYLEQYQEKRVLADSSFTRTEICNLLGLPKTRSYFADVLRGKKVSSRMVDKFIDLLELDKKEAAYFKAMVQLDQAKNENVRAQAMEPLL